MIVGTAGHIDHGKTALIKALTGVDTDRLKEEKARGISIELGYAYLPIDAGNTGPAAVIGFVDVPGHERFVDHMLAGASGIDYVVLAVAADDGPMPQTREHLQILSLLGLTRGLVALTKSDAVSAERLVQAQAEVRAALEGTCLAGAEILNVSAVDGTGINALKEKLITASRAMPPRPSSGHFRLAIDRCFTLPGAGTIVTGMAHAGTAKVGDRMLVSPSGTEVRIRSIHAQNRPTDNCTAGQRCALNVTGLHFEKSDIRRGEWIVQDVIHRPTANFDVALEALASESRPLGHLVNVHFHLGAEHGTGRISLLDAEKLEPGEKALARVTLSRPIGALSGDRFVIRDSAATRTIGGGVLLDPFPPQRGRRKPARLALLSEWRGGGPWGALESQLTQGNAEIDLDRFAASCNIRPEEAQAVYANLPMKRFRSNGRDAALSLHAWESGRNRIIELLQQEHRRAPGEQGPTRERLRKLKPVEAGEDAFNSLIAELLAAREIATTGLSIHLPGHRIRLQAGEEQLWSRIHPLLAANPMAPPRVDQLARQLTVTEKSLRPVLARAVQVGEAYRISEERFFLRQAVRDIAAALRKEAAESTGSKGVTAAGMRDVLGVGRNVVIEILEFFDRVGYTRRVGDSHHLRKENGELFGPL